ncbi:MAG: cyanophycin synthetase [Candidatus Zixiibacteriota bacterium]
MTALAFGHFADAHIDIGVIEVGLGGRLDATNVLAPIMTIVTDINFDHTDVLGSTLRHIAREKAGIIKPHVPHVIGLLPKVADEVMSRTCEARRAPLHRLREDSFIIHPRSLQLDFRSDQLTLRSLKPSLIGVHQLRNTALVLLTVSVLKKRGVVLTKAAVQRGIEGTAWAGRFQILRLPHRPTVILDVGHNMGGVSAFVEAFKLKFPSRRAAVIVGFVKKKQHREMFKSLSEIAASIDIVRLKTKRSGDTREMQQICTELGMTARRSHDIRGAYERLVRSLTPDDIIVVSGSHYLVGEFLSIYGKLKW